MIQGKFFPIPVISPHNLIHGSYIKIKLLSSTDHSSIIIRNHHKASIFKLLSPYIIFQRTMYRAYNYIINTTIWNCPLGTLIVFDHYIHRKIIGKIIQNNFSMSPSICSYGIHSLPMVVPWIFPKSWPTLIQLTICIGPIIKNKPYSFVPNYSCKIFPCKIITSFPSFSYNCNLGI